MFLTGKNGETFKSSFTSEDECTYLCFSVGDHRYLFWNGLNQENLLDCYAKLFGRTERDKGIL